MPPGQLNPERHTGGPDDENRQLPPWSSLFLLLRLVRTRKIKQPRATITANADTTTSIPRTSRVMLTRTQYTGRYHDDMPANYSSSDMK